MIVHAVTRKGFGYRPAEDDEADCLHGPGGAFDIATGKLVLRHERLDMRNVVEQTLESCMAMVESAGHQLSVSLPAEQVWVSGDRSRLEQVVSNLINNAVKYTGDGGHISVESRPGQGSTFHAYMRCADEGTE